MGRLLATPLAVLFLLSPGVLSWLANLRDFSKAPFVLAAIFLLGLMVKRRMTGRAVALAAAAAGFVEGFGLGFRTDVLVTVVPTLLVLLFLVRIKGGRRIRARLRALCVYLVVFTIMGSPTLIKILNDNGAEAGHNVVGGLAVVEPLGLEPASYRILQYMYDQEILSVTASYGMRVCGLPTPRVWFGPIMGEAGRKLIRHVIWTLPGDMISRAWGSVLYVCGGALADKNCFSDAKIDRTTPLLRGIADHLRTWKLGYLMVTLLILAGYRLRFAWAALFLIAYFGGYPILQFDQRSVFHLSILGFWLCGFVINALVLVPLCSLAFRARFREAAANPRLYFVPVLRRVGFFAVSVTVLVLGSFYGARYWQYYQLERLLASYHRPQLEVLDTDIVTDRGTVLHKPREQLPGFVGPDVPIEQKDMYAVNTAYLMLEMTTPKTATAVNVVYESRSGFSGISNLIMVPGSESERPTTTRVFIPVYEYTENISWQSPEVNLRMVQFMGVRFSEGDAALFCNLYRVCNLKDFPLLLTLVLPENMDEFRYYCGLNLFATAGT